MDRSNNNQVLEGDLKCWYSRMAAVLLLIMNGIFITVALLSEHVPRDYVRHLFFGVSLLAAFIVVLTIVYLLFSPSCLNGSDR